MKKLFEEYVYKLWIKFGLKKGYYKLHLFSEHEYYENLINVVMPNNEKFFKQHYANKKRKLPNLISQFKSLD